MMWSHYFPVTLSIQPPGIQTPETPYGKVHMLMSKRDAFFTKRAFNSLQAGCVITHDSKAWGHPHQTSSPGRHSARPSCSRYTTAEAPFLSRRFP